MNRILTVLFLLLSIQMLQAQSKEDLFNFTYDGFELSGILNFPLEADPKGIVLIIHGDGQTNAVEGKWWYDVRHAMVHAGYATFIWDKMGCGKSEGVYVQGRPVADEAKEVLAAVEQLKKMKVPGAERIGLWGISRAGWINPLVIDQSEDIDFWISVSGVNDHETFRYLLEQNLRISGLSQDSVELITKEWHDGLLLSKSGASYEYYQNSTKHLQTNPLWQRLNGTVSEEGYYAYQKILEECTLNKETDLPLYVEDFEDILSGIDIPVLALFGEKDMAVDWKSTKSLYEAVLAPNTSLSIKTFSDCNHNMWTCTTGGLYEYEEAGWEYVRCEGFLRSMIDWLNDLDDKALNKK